MENERRPLGYEIYIVVRDRDYPFPEGPQEWEAGWVGWTGMAGDMEPAVFRNSDEAMAKAEALSVVLP